MASAALAQPMLPYITREIFKQFSCPFRIRGDSSHSNFHRLSMVPMSHLTCVAGSVSVIVQRSNPACPFLRQLFSFNTRAWSKSTRSSSKSRMALNGSLSLSGYKELLSWSDLPRIEDVLHLVSISCPVLARLLVHVIRWT